MSKKVYILLLNLLLCCALGNAQDTQKSELQQQAETENEKGNVANARHHYIRSFEDYAAKGQIRQAVACGVKAAEIYYKQEGTYKESFELLRRIDQTIREGKLDASTTAALQYQVTNQRFQMYMKMRRKESATEHLNVMDKQATLAGDENLTNDLLYNKAIFYYTFGPNEKGNAVFKEMASKLTAQKEYDKVDEVYQTLIDNGRKSGNAILVAQSYKSYMVWKDSVNALKSADEIGALKHQIADNEVAIAEKDSSLTTRWVIIVGLGILAAALAAALVIGAIVLLRFILLTRKQAKTIKLENEKNALKAKFISKISAQLDPTLKKLDSRLPEVKALQDYSRHIQTLAELENSTEAVEIEDVQIAPFCEGLMQEIRDKVKSDVTLKVNTPKMTAPMNKEYVAHILRHLLENAAEFTPESGHISLEYKKRGAHKFQFLVSDTGAGIPEERREDVFKPFREIRDLTTGDGLGLPICKQMAQKMNGDLDIDPEYNKGTRFVLDLVS